MTILPVNSLKCDSKYFFVDGKNCTRQRGENFSLADVVTLLLNSSFYADAEEKNLDVRHLDYVYGYLRGYRQSLIPVIVAMDSRIL